MLDRNELKEISQVRDEAPCFVSLYLDVNPLTNPKGDFAIRFKNMLKNTVESLDKNVHKLVKEDLLRIDAYVSGNKRQFKKGLVIVSSVRNSLWKEFHLSVPVRSELVVEKSPYINPLLDILDHYQRYSVLLVDKESARIFTIHLGEIVEYSEVHTPDVPGKHKKGGWFALSQNHYERHIDYHVGLHLKDVVKKLESFLAGEQISGLVVGGSDEALSMTKDLLPKVVSSKIIGTFQAGMTARTDEVLGKVEPVINAHEKRKKDETVDKLITQAMKNENAVLGLENVLDALKGGKVTKLIYLRDYDPAGYACKCRFISAQDIKECPSCKEIMEKADHLLDVLVQKAVGQGATVEVVGDNQKLSDSGGIGAILRF
ncbi:MAG TPA: Vms1/Ankzf1 family peptidyl-tRNA hydrolase [Thermodesulfovibrionales bacterium]|nr:Vms1/Ankzf1 family peptidyl-tRNA hydrolase [Thermodesulfovibrionales bacterium]